MKIRISGEIGWDVTAEQIRNKLNYATGDIDIEIDSPGGYVFEGISIYNAIKDYKGGDVTVTVVGLAASMASYIMLAGTKLKIKSNAIVMIHNPSTYACGDYNDMKDCATILEKLAILSREKYSEKTKFTPEEIKALMDKETYFIGKDELSAWGEVIEEESTGAQELDFELTKAHANERISAVKSKIAKIPEAQIKSDLGKIAAILPNFEQKAVIENEIKNETNKMKEKTEVKKMDLQTLKSEHPTLVAQIKSETLNKERERVKAHLTFADVAPETAIKAIEDGSEYSPSLAAQYNRACYSKATIKQMEDENPEDVKPKEDVAESEEEKINKEIEQKMRKAAGLE